MHEKGNGIRKAANSAILAIAALILAGCGSGGNVAVKSAEAAYTRAMEEYKDEDWLEAQKYFDIIKLQYPASNYADDAQYYIAEINYEKGEFILAAYNYNSLIRIHPGSEYVKMAHFKTAMSFYELAPSYDRDQAYTKKAIQAFSDFQAIYPEGPLYKKAGDYIQELRGRLANADMAKAELYRNMDSPHSALIYYNAVLDSYPDTEFYEPAYLGKIEVLIKMGKYEEAKGIISLYKGLFPESPNLSQVINMEQSLQQ